MLTGWLIIIAVLLAAYAGEVVKGERTLAYLLCFIPVVLVPWLVILMIYRGKPDSQRLCYYVVPGYFLMYLFVMLTGSTSMVFSFILPLLSLLILYHHPNLILYTGIASLAVNLFSIYQRFQAGLLDVSSSKDAEIQLALIVLCFGGCYIATRLYDEISRANYDYLKRLNATNRDIQAMSVQTITTIARMLDARDSYTEGHSQRVAVYCTSLAKGLGMSEEEIDNVHKVALLHDIGKIGVPDAVLNKPGRLSDEEYAAMKQHTTVGGEIIKDVKTIPNIYDGVRHHHERYDGRGYPDGLKGEQIPYIARLIAVADAYDAMTSTRVYRKHLMNEKVMSELENGAGTQFDPDVVGKLIELLNAGVIENLSPDMGQKAN